MQIAYEILRYLKDGKFHSGTALAQLLKVSRSSIWKGVDFLRRLHVVIEAVTGRGYRCVTPIELLEKKLLIPLLSPAIQHALPRIEIVPMISSTNDYLMQGIGLGIQKGTVCIAEMQTAGRGRQGKQWVSPFGRNIYCSLYWELPLRAVDLSGLTLVVGLAVLEGLKKIAPLPANTGLKWPNDLWSQNAKLCGILIESVSADGFTQVIIGFGMNLNMPPHVEITQAWTDLKELFGFLPSRHTVLAAILSELVEGLDLFRHQGFSAFRDRWKQYDLLAGQAIELMGPEGVKQYGEARGVNERGELLVEIDGVLKAVRSAQVSIRPH